MAEEGGPSSRAIRRPAKMIPVSRRVGGGRGGGVYVPGWCELEQCEEEADRRGRGWNSREERAVAVEREVVGVGGGRERE